MPRTVTAVHDDKRESLRDAIRKECFELCVGCRHGHPLDLETGVHTKKLSCHIGSKESLEEILGRPLTKEEISKKCVHCKAKLPFGNAKDHHIQTTKCGALNERKELAELGGHSITEVP